MKKWLCLWLMCIGTTVAADPIRVIDSVGAEVTIAATAQRIVALSPHLVENLFSLGVGDRIVGTIRYADYPEAAKQIPRIGNLQQISIEAIVALQPDLVLVWASGTSPTIVQQLRALGLTVYQDEPKTLDDVAHSLHNFGALVGEQRRAQQLTQQYLDALARLRRQFSQQTPVSVLYQIWHEPLQTINGQHLISDVITLCGGQNIFFDTPVLAPKISEESVVARNPQVIIASAIDGKVPGWLQSWQRWRELSAVRYQQLYSIDADLLERHTLRIVQGATQMCDAIQSARAVLE